jgi:hypothetical protein
LQNGGGISAGIYFSIDKPVGRVHASVDRSGTLGPPWTDGGADRGGVGALWEGGAQGARLGPHRSSGGGVAIGRRRWHDEVTGNSVGRVSGTGEERRRARLGVECSGGRRGGFYRAGVGRREGWPE